MKHLLLLKGLLSQVCPVLICLPEVAHKVPAHFVFLWWDLLHIGHGCYLLLESNDWEGQSVLQNGKKKISSLPSNQRKWNFLDRTLVVKEIVCMIKEIYMLEKKTRSCCQRSITWRYHNLYSHKKVRNGHLYLREQSHVSGLKVNNSSCRELYNYISKLNHTGCFFSFSE